MWKSPGTYIGALLGLVVELTAPWPNLVLAVSDYVFASPFVGDFPGLSPAVTLARLFFALVFLPVAFAFGGWKLATR
jgi:hypothetical protein